MASFIYPRTISVSRAAVAVEFGASPYSGESQAEESFVIQGVPASIQLKRPSGKQETGLPAGAAKTTWRVFIPLGAMDFTIVKTRDIVTDDLGNRFQVLANYANSMGAAWLVEKLEV